MKYASELNQRILRDMDDCVVALDHRGHIMYMNPQCQLLLDLQNDVLGRTYAEVFFDRQDTHNDDFHQFLVDAVLEKERTHTGTVSFTDTQNNNRYLRVTSSFLKNEADRDAKILALADKLSNIRAIHRDQKTVGDQLWERFNEKRKEKHLVVV